MDPALSVIVPTRERAGTLRYTLASTLAHSNHDYEVIVSDNFSSDDTAAVIGSISDKRLRYFKTPKRLSMCDNYEFALQQARGSHVLIIGDDDAVIPGALDSLVAEISSGATKQIYAWPLHVYDWPAEGHGARVAHLAPQRPRFEVDLRRHARFVMAMGGWKYYELPSPYHAAVPLQLLDAIRARTGRVFHSTQPDVFTAMALPSVAERSVNLGYTVSFNGRSAKSNGRGFVASTARLNLTTFLQEYTDYAYHHTLFPGVGGIANMIPDAVLKARDLFPGLYADVPFGYEAMWAYLCRLRFTSAIDVLKNRSALRQYHSFKARDFLRYLAMQEAGAARRKLLDGWSQRKGIMRQPPDNIMDFAMSLVGKSASS